MTDTKANILVVGSVNMDIVVRAPHMPSPGETVLGRGFVTSPGGKGANQAVAAARLGASVTMIGRVGDDAFGAELMEGLRAENIDCNSVLVTDNCASGVAVIIVDSIGENSIVVASAANHRLTPDDVYGRVELFERADTLLIQLELPLPTVRASIDLAKRHGCRIILDPAPAPKSFPPELCKVDIITPNVSEATMITGSRTGEERADRNIALDLIDRGAKAAVLKLGSRGSLVASGDGEFSRAPAFKVPIVDTTGAGDAFTAALAVSVTSGLGLEEATRFANAAGAVACTRLGAQNAMPNTLEVQMLIDDQPQQ